MTKKYNYSFTQSASNHKKHTHIADLEMKIYSDLSNKESIPTLIGVNIEYKNKDIQGLTMDEIAHTLSSLVIYHLHGIPEHLRAAAKVSMISAVIDQLSMVDNKEVNKKENNEK